MSQNLSSAAVVIGASRVKISYERLLFSYEGIGFVYVCVRARARSHAQKVNIPCICSLTDCLGYTNS